MKDYKDLRVWQSSMLLVKEVYSLTKRLPKEELYGLSNQLQRAVVSIPSNIAEGYGRGATKEYIRFLNIARGSEYEIETQLQICVLLEYLSENDIFKAMELCGEVGRMLNALIRSLTDKNRD